MIALGMEVAGKMAKRDKFEKSRRKHWKGLLMDYM